MGEAIDYRVKYFLIGSSRRHGGYTTGIYEDFLVSAESLREAIDLARANTPEGYRLEGVVEAYSFETNPPRLSQRRAEDNG